MSAIPQNPETRKQSLPFQKIIELAKKFLARIKKSIKRLFWTLVVSLSAGIALLAWLFLNQSSWGQTMGSAAGALIGLTGVFFGTICLTILKDLYSRYERRDLAKDIHDDLIKIAEVENPGESDYSDFSKAFLNILETLLQKQ